MEVVSQLRAKRLPTVPSTIEQELATNPFFREDSLALQETIKMVGKKPAEVFAEVRRLKDSF
jgi:hydroxyacylglutathione hydrolase